MAVGEEATSLWLSSTHNVSAISMLAIFCESSSFSLSHISEGLFCFVETKENDMEVSVSGSPAQIQRDGHHVSVAWNPDASTEPAGSLPGTTAGAYMFL